MRKVLFPKRSQSRHPVDSGRLVVLTCSPRSFTFSIDNHNLTIIEADGIEHDPVTVDSLEIFVGESRVYLPSSGAMILKII